MMYPLKSVDFQRQKAWERGYEAGVKGLKAEVCSEQRGTIYFDDWHDGFEAGERLSDDNS